jgi:hypothetical protein
MPTNASLAYLNGFWTVTYDHQGPKEWLDLIGTPLAGVNLVVRDGVLAGVSNGGVTMRGTLSPIAVDLVSFDLEVSAVFADAHAVLMDPLRGPVRDSVRHHSQLKLTQSGGSLRRVVFNMRRVSQLPS